MTFVATGIAVPRGGLASSLALKPGDWTPTLTRRAWCVDVAELRPWQPSTVKIDVDHTNAIVGQAIAFERLNDELWATAEMNGPMPETDRELYWSVASDTDRHGADGVISRIGVVERTAMLSSRPLIFVPELASAIRDPRIPEHVRGVLQRAQEAHREREDGEPLLVLGKRDSYRSALMALRQRASSEVAAVKRPSGPMHHSRPYHGILSVR